jgi:tetratricopeptide (TPR) repeat protein
MSASRIRALGLALALVVLSGCGDPILWARWRAERRFWQAQREVDRILVSPRIAAPQDFRRAEQAFRAIVVEFPASRWGRPGASRMEVDVGEISARSALALARLAELQSRGDEAVAGYAAVERDWGLLPELVLEAAVLRAAALERMGRGDEALAGWESISRRFEIVEPARATVRMPVVDAGLRVAEAFAARGRTAARDSTLRAEETRYRAALAPLPDGPEATRLLDAIAEARGLRGDFDGALGAARDALFHAGAHADSALARRVLAIGERLFQAGRWDSARAYARWDQTGFQGRLRLPALDLEARAWKNAGRSDSALAVYDRILEEYSGRPEADAEARFQRAVLLEAMNEWALARTEFSALCAAHPSHPRSLESWALVVRHHERAGEHELARIEADHALAAIDQWIAMQHDESERSRAREARVAVQLEAGRNREAIVELRALWNAVGLSPASARLGERAAEAAEKLRDAALARNLWQILSQRAPDAEVRRRAAAALVGGHS